MENTEQHIQSLGLLPVSEKPSPAYDDDIGSMSVPNHSRTRRYSKALIIVAISSGLLILTLLTLYFLHGNVANSSRVILQNPCGNTVSEAKARGCEWDVLSFCWLPEQCLDRELTQAFRDAGPWKFYGDKNKTILIGEEEFGENEQTVYLTNELHAAHCAFTWLKFHRALTTGKMIHAQLDMTHTEHCSHVIRDHHDPEGIKVWANIMFPDCGYMSADFPPKTQY